MKVRHANEQEFNQFNADLLKEMQEQVVANGGGKPTQEEALGVLFANRYRHFNQDQKAVIRESILFTLLK